MQRSEFRAGAQRATSRGFTMAELMAVVAIVGILALISTASYRKYVAHSKIAEVPPMFLSIKAAEEAYKDETFQYLGPSTDLTAYYPANSLPGKQKMNFAGTGNGSALWERLGVQAAGPVLFVYACTAGANSAPTALGSDITVTGWPATIAAPWYVVKARADIYGNGADTVFATASFTGDLYKAND